MIGCSSVIFSVVFLPSLQGNKKAQTGPNTEIPAAAARGLIDGHIRSTLAEAQPLPLRKYNV